MIRRSDEPMTPEERARRVQALQALPNPRPTLRALLLLIPGVFFAAAFALRKVHAGFIAGLAALGVIAVAVCMWTELRLGKASLLSRFHKKLLEDELKAGTVPVLEIECDAAWRVESIEPDCDLVLLKTGMDEYIVLGGELAEDGESVPARFTLRDDVVIRDARAQAVAFEPDSLDADVVYRDDGQMLKLLEKPLVGSDLPPEWQQIVIPTNDDHL